MKSLCDEARPIFNDGDVIVLQEANGGYLMRTERYGLFKHVLVVGSEQAEAREKHFTIKQLANDSIALQADNGLYLCRIGHDDDLDNVILAIGPNTEAAATHFKPRRQDGDKLTLQADNGLYLAIGDDGSVILVRAEECELAAQLFEATIRSRSQSLLH
ncbi:hypothetical protein EPA93_27440 [Ktedonosporobacter rubrisoli]|uniref:Uncharacterized protein n=1 Tax=Ktedonosporobacter rubrisoli TaxID=2509675 RepID=A0A4P6JVX0_KTERU|nr:hypothetical protein [Ktedonosporobacter rubrisoli]QBD79512.1 hypothetical protein EPA93_27440 [Ktedonosporobacter rubrisoli]